MSVSLYDIAGDVLKLEAILEDPDSQDDEALAEAMAEAMSGTKEQLEQKVNGCVAMLRNWEATAGMIKAEETRLAARRKIFENKGARLRASMLLNLQRLDSPTMKLTLATVGRSKGREGVVVSDDMALPQGYFESVYVVKPDKAALKKLWSETDEDDRSDLPGFHVERGPESLAIK